MSILWYSIVYIILLNNIKIIISILYTGRIARQILESMPQYMILKFYSILLYKSNITCVYNNMYIMIKRYQNHNFDVVHKPYCTAHTRNYVSIYDSRIILNSTSYKGIMLCAYYSMYNMVRQYQNHIFNIVLRS